MTRHDSSHRSLLGALAAGFGLISLAQAQTPAAPTAPPTPPEAAADEPQRMPVVRAKASALRSGKDQLQAVTSRVGKGEQELRDIPQSLTVVTERLIDDRNLDTLKQALHNTAGISFQAAEGGEEDIRLRGFSLASTGDIFVDGIRDPAFYDRDTFNNDRIELLRGAASMLFGRGSSGGAVNQVSKAPMLFGRNDVSVTLGPGGYLRSTADLNIRLGENAAARFNTMLTQADQGGDRIDKQGFAASVGLGLGTADEFSASLYHLKNDNGIAYGMPWLSAAPGSSVRLLVPVPAGNVYAAASDINRGGADTGTLQHVHRFGAGNELRTTLRLGRYSRDLRASAIRFANASLQPDGQAVSALTLSEATVLTRGNSVKIQDLDTLALQSDYSGRFQLLGQRHQLLAGVDVSREDFDNFGAVAIAKPMTTLGTPNDGGGIDESQRVIFPNRSFAARGLGAYAQDLVQLAPEWKLLLGLRWDQFRGRYSAPELIASNGSVIAASQRERSDALWSKRFGLLYQPTPFQSWHFSYGTAFNTSGDTYQYDALGSNTPPEGSVNYELGGKFDLADGKLSLGFALFHAIKTHERNRDADSVTPTTYVLSGQRHAAGLEFDIAGRITPAWEVFASYAFIPDARIDKGVAAIAGSAAQSLQGEPVGSRPGLVPRHSGTVWTTYQLNPHWRLGAGLNLRSAMAPYLVTSFEAPGYATADLMAELTLGELSFKLNLNNLTDKRYADMLYRGHYIPGKPRGLQFTGSYRF